MDLVYLGLILGFATLTLAFVRICQHAEGKQP